MADPATYMPIVLISPRRRGVPQKFESTASSKPRRGAPDSIPGIRGGREDASEELLAKLAGTRRAFHRGDGRLNHPVAWGISAPAAWASRSAKLALLHRFAPVCPPAILPADRAATSTSPTNINWSMIRSISVFLSARTREAYFEFVGEFVGARFQEAYPCPVSHTVGGIRQLINADVPILANTRM